MIRLGIVLLASWGVLASVPAAAQRPQGVGCTRNSDCQAPLVCFPSGRCDAECREHRDCPREWSCQGAGTWSARCVPPAGDLVGRVERTAGEAAACAVRVVGHPRWTSCDRNGGFHLAGLARGRYEVSISIPGHGSRIVSAWVNPAMYNDLGTILVRRSGIQPVRFWLPRRR